ncbi:MAG: RtcB family protein [archaeon]
MEIKKINDNLFVVPKHGNMNVPLKIYATEKLLEKLKNDRSIQQGINVASLPGIVNDSIMLPDAHEGYGFSIGGVAAFDLESGIITPGGIGFDINCLTEDSYILVEHGYYKKISEFESDFIEIDSNSLTQKIKQRIILNKFISFDMQKNEFTRKDALFFLKKKVNEQIYEIITEKGYSIKATTEHPILTKNGMVECQKLSNESEIAIFPFKGVEYKTNSDKMIADDSCFTIQEKHELEKRSLIPLTLNNPSTPIISKLFGYLLGDGSIYLSGEKGFVNAYGKKEDLELIKEDFARLGFSASIYSRKRKHAIPTRYGIVKFEKENYELHVSSKSLAKLFFAMGYPNGVKTITDFSVPDWIMNSELYIKRLFLSGFFGAELSSPKTHTKTGFDCPALSINKNTAKLENARNFAVQLIKLLSEFDVKTDKLLVREDYFNKHGKTSRIRLQLSSNEDNLINLWEKIGFSYNIKRDFLSKAALLYIKEKKEQNKYRIETAKKIKELKKTGLALKEVIKLLESTFANQRFIERHYYENAKQRISLDFISFNDYLENKKNEVLEYGNLFDRIKSISKINYIGNVYDFAISDTHNFIANNIIVSNCGVRLIKTDLTKEEVMPKIKALLDVIYKAVPSGVGEGSGLRLDDRELDLVLENGGQWALSKGYGTKEDVDNCESHGRIAAADARKVTPKAKKRGRDQLGTLGSGNHFLEIQYVDEIYNPVAAKVFGITKVGQVTIMIHCGSRGLGHQVCSDYLRLMEDSYPDIMAKLPEKDLIYAPFNSELGQNYFKAMCAAANFAWANRHIIAHYVRKSFLEVFPKADISTIYDVAHNIAKIEEHEINGIMKKLIVHRKGATRAFPPNHPEIPEKYRKIGQPVIIPGSMGTTSYILVGTKEGMKETFGSTAHGAGRVMSRHEALRQFNGERVKQDLEKRNIVIKTGSIRGIAEESPDVYKDIDEVIKVSDSAGIGKAVARVRPLGVIKG